VKSSRVVVILSLVFFIVLAPAASAQFFSPWAISEMQPDIPQGGRANTISVHPLSNDTMLVASDSGGLFRSTDRGVTWRHIDGLPEFRTRSVAYVPADPNIVIATTWRDWRAVNGGGIWRSTDGGTTWSQIPSPLPPAGSTAMFEGEEISIAPDNGVIYVATSYGVSYSADRGVTWTHSDPFGGSDHGVRSVLALQNSLVIAGGLRGIRRSLNGGVAWVAATSGAGLIADLHAFGRSPYWIDQAYVVNNNTELYYTENGGDAWTRITRAPAGGGPCGGITFVKAQPEQIINSPVDRTILLWFGNRCGLYTLACPELGARSFNYSGTWAQMTIDHGDTRDLAFDSTNQALLLGTDGGLHKTNDGGTHWTYTGGGRNGYNALQIAEITGQAIASPSRYDLYFGTQDNNLWASPDTGRSWINPVCCEGNYIEAEHRVPTPADSKVTFVACGPCGDYLTGALFTGIASWPSPTSPNGEPKLVGRNFHVQGVNNSSAFSKGYAYSRNLGTSWLQYAPMREDRLSMPRLSQGLLVPVLYQAIRTGITSAGRNVDTLARITKNLLSSTAFVRYPQMNGFGGLGINPTMWAWYEVFGVDPVNSRHLIAPDLINEKMMESFDAGNNWTEIPALTSLVTDSGRYLFGWSMFTNASVVSFNRDNPNLVAVGTIQGGVLISADRGATWSRVPGSGRATYITAIEWKSSTEAIVSTYGRGLWRITSRFVLPLPRFDGFCKGICTTVPFGSSTETYSGAVLVFNGKVQGARAVNGALTELYVTPSSSVVFFSDTSDLSGIKVTESDKDAGFIGLTPPATPAKTSMVGMTLGKSINPLSAAYTQDPLVLYQPTDTEKNQDNDPIGNDLSPTIGKPYLELNLADSNAVEPSAPMTLAGTYFPPAASLEITLDDSTAAKIKTNDKGELAATITAPATEGLHSVKVLDSATRKLLDGAMFLVKHRD